MNPNRKPATGCSRKMAGSSVIHSKDHSMHIPSTSGARQTPRLDIHEPFIVARTFQALRERGLPADPESLSEIDYRYFDGSRWRKTPPPRAVRYELQGGRR